MTVLELYNRLDDLIDAGHADLPVYGAGARICPLLVTSAAHSYGNDFPDLTRGSREYITLNLDGITTREG